MNKNSYDLLGCLILGMSVLLSACGDKQDSSIQKTAVVDQPASGYESTLAEGIDFKKSGYPSFLIDASGVSFPEYWGRWTDANLGPVAKFRFNKPLPKKFVLELQANAIGLNVGQPIKIRAGNIEKTITVKNWPDQTIYEVKFDEVAFADTIEILPPSPLVPKDSDQKSTDQRRLGLGLIALKIKPLG